MTRLLAVLLCAAPLAAGAEEPAPEAARFGDWLSARGDYYRAIGEYERALFLDPGGPAAPRLELRIAEAYAAGGKPDAAGAILRRLAAQDGDAAVRDAAQFELGLVRYRAHDPEAAAAALRGYLALPSPAAGPGPHRARLLLSLAHLHAGDAGQARRDLEGLGAGHASDADALRAGIRDVEATPRRSPLAAGLLSAVVPGLGHAYAGDPKAGLGALALNGLFLWATVDAFRAHQWGLGGLLAVGESIWYGGAVFGAVAEAMRFNRDARETAVQVAEARVRWVVELVPGGVTAGLAGSLDPWPAASPSSSRPGP